MADATRRALQARATNAARHTRSLAAIEPAWGSTTRRLAGGWLVLAGPGMYVNQAMAAGIDVDLTVDDLAMIVDRSAAIGVTPTLEVTAETTPGGLRVARRLGWLHRTGGDITVLTRSVSEPVEAPDDVVVRRVVTPDQLRRWQETSAVGWGHDTESARRTADAFAAAAQALDSEHMMMAFDSVDGRPVGCASMTVDGGVAMLGGMSTVPAERRRGVQAALIRHRVEQAERLGCHLALSTAASGSDSERNLRRHGFSPAATIERWSGPGPDGAEPSR